MIKELISKFDFRKAVLSPAEFRPYKTLGDFGLGIGKTGPANRHDIDNEKLFDLYARLQKGDFNKPVESKIPVICVDGRIDHNNTRLNEPSAAGGSLAFVYAYVLGTRNDLTGHERDLVVEMISYLKKLDYHISVHGDDMAECGCGACSKEGKIYHYIIKHIDEIAELASQYNVNISEADKAHFVHKAKKIIERKDYLEEKRVDILKIAESTGAQYEDMTGEHAELAIVLNTRAGTTIDRSAIIEAYGPEYNIFVVDVWSFEQAAKELSAFDEKSSAPSLFLESIIVHNIATVAVLGNRSLPLVEVV